MKKIRHKRIRHRRWPLIPKVILISLLSLVATSIVIISYSYFSVNVKVYTDDGQTSLFRMGMELNTFFDIINSGTTAGNVSDGTDLGIVCTDTSVATAYTSGTTMSANTLYYNASGNYVFNSKATWGSASNPYIISKINHLQNLYVLQNAGYFNSLTGNGNDSGKLTENCMPYFLVCTSIGTPVTINGEGRTFEYIGNDTYPFIGYLGGSFASGTTTVGGKTSSQSAIYDLVSITDNDIIDVGLFGRIGYLGNDSAVTNNQFSGSVSTVRNLLLYDVQVKVKSKSTWQSIWDKITSHLFSNSDSQDLTASENHHIGILAGHVDYATVEYISVYYSNDSTAAIDVQHTDKNSGTSANYYSVSGILGFVNGMNSTHKNGKVSLDGLSDDDISVSSGGSGTGGGLVSGTGRGYVTATEVFNNYHDSGQIVKCTITNNGATTYKYGIVVEVTTDVAAGTITGTLSDGTTPVTVEQDSTTGGIVAVITTSYKNFFGQTETDTQKWSEFVLHYEGKYYYYAASTNVLTEATSVETTGVSLKYAARYSSDSAQFTKLCTQYERDRIGSTLINWKQTTDRFYFYDGVFTFAISETTDTITETWDDQVGKITVGQDNDASWTQDESALPNSVVAFMKPVKTEAELRSGKELFIAYKDGNSYHIVTLAGNSTYTAGQGNNAVTTPQTTLSLVSSDLMTTIEASLNNGSLTLDEGSYTNIAQLQSDWDDIQVLDLGIVGNSGLTLEQLRKTYQVKVTAEQQDPTSGTFEEDGETPATSNLISNMQTNVSGAYYRVNGTSNSSSQGASEVSTLSDSTYGDNFQLFTLEGTATINLGNAWSVINSYNGTYYKDDEVSPINDSNTIPLSTIQNGGLITKTENHLYTDGYFFFWTEKQSGRWKYVYFWVDGNGTRHQLDTVNASRDNDGYNYFSGHYTNSLDGQELYTKTFTVNGTTRTLSLPFFYELDKKYYSSWTNSLLATQYIFGNTEVTTFIESGNTDKKYYKTYTATYHYVIKTMTGSGVTYTFDGASNSCTYIEKVTGKSVSDINNPMDKTGWMYDYGIHKCNYNGKEYYCILVFRYYIDGIILQTMSGSGASFSLVNGSGSNIGNVTLPLTVTDKAITVDGVNYNLYKTANGKLGVRAANFKIDGYFQANVSAGSETTYKLNATTLLKSTPQRVTGLTYPLSNGSTTKNYGLYLADGYLAFMLVHEESGQQYYYKFWHSPKDTDSSTEPYVLRILRRTYTLGEYYSMVVGTDSFASSTGNFGGNGSVTCHSVRNSTDCTVILNGDGTAYLQYTLSGNTRYLSYNTTNSYFTTSSSKDTASKLYLFTAEGTHDSSVGTHIVPIAGTQVGTDYLADQYVLWPNNTYLSTDSSTSAYNPSNGYITDTTYSIKGLANLGWTNNSGRSLSRSDLGKVFSLGDGISDVNMMNLWGGNTGTILGSDNYVKAPVGTNGEEAYIPTGCIAFKTNTTNENNKVRVIVAVPVSDYYYGQVGVGTSSALNPAEDTGMDYSSDYSFCMWKVDEANTSQNYSFSVSNCYAAFELPRSSPYNPDTVNEQYYKNISGNSMSVTSTGESNQSVKKYINVTLNGSTYRAYLNGDEILVAYEFTAKEEGIYLLGSTKECRIVFFSADATASSGKDGMTSYRLGTIDFVYDNGVGSAGSLILTTDKGDSSSDGVYHYDANYYPTLCLLGTDNNNGEHSILNGDEDVSSKTLNNRTITYSNINDFTIFVQRKRTSSASEINWHVQGGTSYANGIADAAYIKLVRYSIDADVVNRSSDSVRQQQ